MKRVGRVDIPQEAFLAVLKVTGEKKKIRSRAFFFSFHSSSDSIGYLPAGNKKCCFTGRRPDAKLASDGAPKTRPDRKPRIFCLTD